MNKTTKYSICVAVAVIMYILGVLPQVYAMGIYVSFGYLMYASYRSEHLSWGQTIALMIACGVMSLFGAAGTIYHAGIAWFITASLVLVGIILVVKYFLDEAED